MVLETLGVLLGVGGSVGKLVNLGFKLNATEEDMANTAMILILISNEAESVRLSRDRLISHLTSDQKQRIQTALDRAYQLVDMSNKLVNRRFTEPVKGGGMLRLSDRLVWVFRDKAMALNHQNVLGLLHGTLLTISIELAILRSFVVASRSESPKIVGMDGIHTQCLILPVDTSLTTTPVATSDIQDGENYSPQSKLAILEDSKQPCMETAQHLVDTFEESTDVQLEFSIKMSLKKRFTYPAMRTQDICQPTSIPGDLKRRFSDRKRVGSFAEELVDIGTRT